MRISWNIPGGLGNCADQGPHGEDIEDEGFSLVTMRRQRVEKNQEQRSNRMGTNGQRTQPSLSADGKRSREIELREGDWRCVVQDCQGEINFRRRTECWKCGADKNGKS